MRKLVGVNAYTEGDDLGPDILRIDPAFEVEQVDRLRTVREQRDPDAVARTLDSLAEAAGDPGTN